MDLIPGIKKFLGPSLRDVIENFCIFGYFAIANVWTWYIIPDMIPVNNPYIIGMIVLCAIGGLLFRGFRGLVLGALLFPAGIALINGSFFPIFFFGWLIGLLFAFLTTIPFPVAGNVGIFLVYLFCTVGLVFLAGLFVLDKGHGKNEAVSDEQDDYSSPSFTMDLWGGRWG